MSISSIEMPGGPEVEQPFLAVVESPEAMGKWEIHQGPNVPGGVRFHKIQSPESVIADVWYQFAEVWKSLLEFGYAPQNVEWLDRHGNFEEWLTQVRTALKAAREHLVSASESDKGISPL